MAVARRRIVHRLERRSVGDRQVGGQHLDDPIAQAIIVLKRRTKLSAQRSSAFEFEDEIGQGRYLLAYPIGHARMVADEGRASEPK